MAEIESQICGCDALGMKLMGTFFTAMFVLAQWALRECDDNDV